MEIKFECNPLSLHCEFEAFIRNRKLSKYLGASKWKNEVMVIKNTPNKNDWPRAISEICFLISLQTCSVLANQNVQIWEF